MCFLCATNLSYQKDPCSVSTSDRKLSLKNLTIVHLSRPVHESSSLRLWPSRIAFSGLGRRGLDYLFFIIFFLFTTVDLPSRVMSGVKRDCVRSYGHYLHSKLKETERKLKWVFSSYPQTRVRAYASIVRVSYSSLFVSSTLFAVLLRCVSVCSFVVVAKKVVCVWGFFLKLTVNRETWRISRGRDWPSVPLLLTLPDKTDTSSEVKHVCWPLNDTVSWPPREHHKPVCMRWLCPMYIRF